MLFSEQSTIGPHRDTSVQRHSLLAELLDAFQITFPKIRYQFFPELNLLNAQALILQNQRIVRLYGGLAFHREMARDGLAFALLHETGHHLADGARLPWNPLIACECSADFWALNLGHKMLSDRAGWAISFFKALDEVNALVKVIEPEIVPSEAGDPACWAKRWSHRRDSILGRRSPPTDHTCPLSDEVLDRA